MREELDLEDVVPEGAENEVSWGCGCFLEDVRVNEVVFGGEREVDGAVVLPGAWGEGE